MIFTFLDGTECKAWYGTGNNDMYQFMDAKCLGVGGSKTGRFALYLGNDFWRGSSNLTDCYDNDKCLASDTDFNCVELEVWGLN